MFLLIYGDSNAVCEELKSYYNFRATAYYEWDYLSPLESMVESVGIVLGEKYTSEDLTERIKTALLKETSSILADEALDQVRKVTDRWKELNMHFIGAVKNIPSSVGLDVTPSYRILLCSEESHPPERALYDCAVGNNYDLVVETLDKDPKEVAALIGDSLHRKLITSFTEQKRLNDANGSSA